jgi:glycosyltransferase involved in cell wall biosynthesis
MEPIAQNDLRAVYNRASVVVLNSVDEGFGLALTEAMLCKTAVVGTESGGISDIIDDGETGILVPPDNPARLADGLQLLLEDSILRNRLAEAGYRKALARYSSRSSARNYGELFSRVE